MIFIYSFKSIMYLGRVFRARQAHSKIGRLTQWESAILTRWKSGVQIPDRPPSKQNQVFMLLKATTT